MLCLLLFLFFFFNDPATTEIYTLSLHDALPICTCWRTITFAASKNTIPIISRCSRRSCCRNFNPATLYGNATCRDRKSTRLNSSHVEISYAVFCLKKKKKIQSTNKNAHKQPD